jgi:hypothetical protein
MPAFQRAVADGSDAVKGDFRVSSDNIGMVMHSSPVEWFESIGCHGVKVEETPAAKLQQCKMALTSYTFLSAPQLLAYTKDTAITMFCVKQSKDLPRAISTLIENNAQDRSFLEVKVGDLLGLNLAAAPGWDQVYFLAEGDSKEDLNMFLAKVSPQLQARVFMYEFGPDWLNWGQNYPQIIKEFVHSHGMRALAASTKFMPSVQAQQDMFQQQAIDVVYTYDTKNAVQARTNTNVARGVTPPS